MTTTAVTNAAPSIASTAASSSTSSTSSSSSSGSDAVGSQNYFLTLLIAQMNNQDPLNPMDSSQVTSQMAEIKHGAGHRSAEYPTEQPLGKCLCDSVPPRMLR